MRASSLAELVIVAAKPDLAAEQGGEGQPP